MVRRHEEAVTCKAGTCGSGLFILLGEKSPHHSKEIFHIWLFDRMNPLILSDFTAHRPDSPFTQSETDRDERRKHLKKVNPIIRWSES